MRGAVPVPGQEEKARVHVAARQRARVALELLAPAQRLHLEADEVPGPLELGRRRAGQVAFLVQLAEPVQRGPAEDARVREVARDAADLPDALVRLAPAARHFAPEVAEEIGDRPVEHAAAAAPGTWPRFRPAPA